MYLFYSWVAAILYHENNVAMKNCVYTFIRGQVSLNFKTCACYFKSKWLDNIAGFSPSICTLTSGRIHFPQLSQHSVIKLEDFVSLTGDEWYAICISLIKMINLFFWGVKDIWSFFFCELSVHGPWFIFLSGSWSFSFSLFYFSRVRVVPGTWWLSEAKHLAPAIQKMWVWSWVGGEDSPERKWQCTPNAYLGNPMDRGTWGP